MRIVAANVRDAQPLETVLTAKATREQFQKLWPVMEQPSELSSPGPTRVVNVELSSGQRATLVFHETRKFVEILAPVEAGIEVGLADLLVDLAVAPIAITWTHPDIDPRAIGALHDSAARDVSNGGDVKNSAEVSFEPNHVESDEAELRRKRLHDAIAALSAGHRQCIQLWLDGFAYDEIARALNLDSDVVKARLRDAKKHLRHHLANEDEYLSQVRGTKAGGGESDGGLTSR